MSETSSSDLGEDGGVSADQLQDYLANVADLPALASLLRFMKSDLIDRVHGELLEHGNYNAENRLTTYADMKLDPFKEAFDTFFAEISGEIVAVRWIGALSDLALASEQGDLDRVKQLEAKVDDYRAAGAWFPPPEHLHSKLIGFGEELGEQLE